MLNVVILAAGLGKRMQSDLPKVLHTLAGKPMLAHVLASARELAPARITVVVGHGADRVKQAFGGQEGLHFALQQPQQGTGHAVQQAVPLLLEGDGKDDVTLVLYGDVPLVQPDTLRRLLAARGDGAAVLTEVLDDSTGYGRIVRDAAGRSAASSSTRTPPRPSAPSRKSTQASWPRRPPGSRTGCPASTTTTPRASTT